MIVNFSTPSGKVEGAIIVSQFNRWHAVHNCDHSNGGFPRGHHAYGRSRGWCLGMSSPNFGDDYRNMVFCGWHSDVKAEKAEVKPEVKEEVKSKAKNPYKIGDFVKHNISGYKAEVIGVYKRIVWLLSPIGGNCSYCHYHEVSPWVEPGPVKLKYKMGDLVLLKENCSTAVWEIVGVNEHGYNIKKVSGNDFRFTINDSNILRKVGVATKE